MIRIEGILLAITFTILLIHIHARCEENEQHLQTLQNVHKHKHNKHNVDRKDRKVHKDPQRIIRDKIKETTQSHLDANTKTLFVFQQKWLRQVEARTLSTNEVKRTDVPKHELPKVLEPFIWSLPESKRPTDIGLRADVEHAPFYHGVASADPLEDGVLLWTRVTPSSWDKPGPPDSIDVQVRVWDNIDSFETSPELVMNATARRENDYTISIDANPLQKPNMTYWYVFQLSDNPDAQSVVGRTRTAPSPDSEDAKLTFAVISCASHFSGFMNGYRHLAYNVTMGGEILQSDGAEEANLQHQRGVVWEENRAESINAVLHLGDYLYDILDDAGCRRAPDVYCSDACQGKRMKIPHRSTDFDIAMPYGRGEQNCSDEGIGMWRYRHSLLLQDPDVRAVRAAHPWITMPDNHDLGEIESTSAMHPALVAFQEWTPVRWTRYVNATGEENFALHRMFKYGNLADIVVLDTRNIGKQDTYLGENQLAFLNTHAFNPTVATNGWRVIMSAVNFMPRNFSRWQGPVFGILLAVVCLSSLPLLCCFLVRCQQHSAPYKFMRTQHHRYTVQEDAPAFAAASSTSSSSSSGASTSSAASAASIPVGETLLSHRGYRACCRCFVAFGSKQCLYAGIAIALGACLFLFGVMFYLTNNLDHSSFTGVTQPFRDARDWDGNEASRVNFLEMLKENGVSDNNIIVSGDIHMTLAANVYDTADGLPEKDEKPDEKTKFGVEFLPSSVTRVNADESVTHALGGAHRPWLIQSILTVYENIFIRSNRHVRFFDMMQHGYGLLNITPERTTANVFWTSYTERGKPAVLARTLVVNRGENEYSDDEF